MDFRGHNRFDSISERDIDLFLLEEFWAGQCWLEWFYDQLRRACPRLPIIEKPSVQAARSVSGLGVDGKPGETDILIIMRGQTPQGEAGVAVLIEDKVSAPLMPQQPERYRTRSESVKRETGCGYSATVLIAPKRYCASVPNAAFDLVLPLEAVHAFLLKRIDGVAGELRDRLQHRALMIEKVCTDIRRCTSIGVIPHEGNTRDIGWIESYVVARDQRLIPKPRPVRGANSAGPAFDLPGKARLLEAARLTGLTGTLELNCYWNLAKGDICISFHNWRELLPILRSWFSTRLSLPDMRIEIATKGNTMYINRNGLPKYDASIKPDDQPYAIDGWMSAMVEMQEWLAGQIAELATVIESQKSLRGTRIVPN